MDIRKVKKLIELLETSDIAEIEIKEGEEAVRISRGGAPVAAPQVFAAPAPVAAPAQAAAPADAAPAEAAIAGHTVNSPMVGTFYRKPAPDKEPFVEVGQTIKKGETVCIIEAMKMMNQVKSEFDGKIISINIGDGEPVEFGQELISIEKS